VLKFKFDYKQNTLAYHKEENTWYEIPEERQFTGNFGSSGFKLEKGWITFKVYLKKIAVFAKLDSDWKVSYYRKDLSKECPVIFTFTETDQIEKVNGKWGKK